MPNHIDQIPPFCPQHIHTSSCNNLKTLPFCSSIELSSISLSYHNSLKPIAVVLNKFFLSWCNFHQTAVGLTITEEGRCWTGRGKKSVQVDLSDEEKEPRTVPTCLLMSSFCESFVTGSQKESFERMQKSWEGLKRKGRKYKKINDSFKKEQL